MRASVDNPPAGGLRARKKAKTRASIAAAAARLFAASGFAAVTMLDVARASEVSEQTVYNYFPTKEALVFDRVDELRRLLLAPAGVPSTGQPGAEPMAADGLVDQFGVWLERGVLGLAGRRSLRQPGGMPRLVATDPGLRRHLLGHARDLASALAEHWTEHEQVDPLAARTLADALLQLFVRVVERLGTLESEAELSALAAEARRTLDLLRPLARMGTR
ncbi:helix-turn-helix domain-containing protein [Kribbella hippodromi]